MPLNTQILRDGTPLQLRWGDFHVAAMVLASAFDHGEGPFSDRHDIYQTDPDMFDCYPDAPFPVSRNLAFMLTSYPMIGRSPLNDGEYVLTGRHRFRDLSDGEILSLIPGDRLVAYRGW